MPPEALTPENEDELFEVLREASEAQRCIELGGAFTKRTMGGEPPTDASVVSLARINRLLAYEPNDLTVSVEAGMPLAELRRLLAENNQMLPLDPPFAAGCTIGGVVAADVSGPRRRRFGTCRDMVIGMRFAAADAKLIQSGGMVVKNVTGLDMAKLMIGSLGTLGVVVSVNFRVYPRPEHSASFAFLSDRLETLDALRTSILRGVAQPVALDLVNAAAMRRMGADLANEYALVAEAVGSEAVVKRYRGEYSRLAVAEECEFLAFDDEASENVWKPIRELASTLVYDDPEAYVLRVVANPARTLKAAAAIVDAGEAPLVARAANGVVYAGCSGLEAASQRVDRLRAQGWATLVEHAPSGRKAELQQWHDPDRGLEIMRRIKERIDPGGLLNPGRLYGRL